MRTLDFSLTARGTQEDPVHATLVGVPPQEQGVLEQALRGRDRRALPCRVQHVPAVEALVGELPAGLVVLWDEGGALERLLKQCRQLHTRRAVERTLLVVLTQRGAEEAEALAEAGADECVAPPGAPWGMRLRALQRRLEETQRAPERRQRKVQRRLAERMAPLGMLAAGVAHEINNPLAYVGCNLRYLGRQLESGPLTPEDVAELREVVAEAQEGVEQIQSTVRALGTFARPDEQERDPVDVHAVVESALRLVRTGLVSQARLEYELVPVPTVLGNAAYLGQVLMHLLVESLRSFPSRPAADNRIRLATRSEGTGWVVVEVEHNGQAPSSEVQARLLAPAFIIAALGGRIELSSPEGQGCLCRLVLPAVEEELEPLWPPRASRQHEQLSPAQ